MTLDPVRSGIDLWPLLSIPYMSPVLVPAMPALSVCTASAEELSNRTDHGEEYFDVIEEHTSWFWFRNRDGYEIARRIARNILRGNLMQGNLPAGTGMFCPNVDGVLCAPIVVRASVHHVWPTGSRLSDQSIIPVRVEDVIAASDGRDHDSAVPPVGLVKCASANSAGTYEATQDGSIRAANIDGTVEVVSAAVGPISVPEPAPTPVLTLALSPSAPVAGDEVVVTGTVTGGSAGDFSAFSASIGGEEIGVTGTGLTRRMVVSAGTLSVLAAVNIGGSTYPASASTQVDPGGAVVLPSVATLAGFGDSITSGGTPGVAASDTFGSKLAQILGATYTNAGISGSVLQNSADASGNARSGNGRNRFVSALLGTNKREMAIVAYGFNDARYTGAPATFNVAEYENDLHEVIAGLRIGGFPADRLLVVAPYYIKDVGLSTGSAGFTDQTREGFEAFVTAARAVAQAHGTWYFDAYAWGLSIGSEYVIHSDNIHLMPATHTLLSAALSTQSQVLNAGAQPTSVSATSPAPGEVSVSWVAAAGSGNYTVEYAVEGSFAFGGAVTASVTNATLTGLTGGQSVRVRVRRGAGPWAYAATPVTITEPTSEYPAGTTFAIEFSGEAGGTLVSATVPTLGDTPTVHPGSSWTPTIRPSGDILIGATTATGASNSTFGGLIVDNLPVADGCWVEFDLNVIEWFISAQLAAYAILGANAGTSTYYMCGYNGSQARIMKRTAGTATNIESVAHTLTTGQDYTIRVECETGVQRLYIDGTLIVSASEPDLSGMGEGVGLVFQVGTSRFSDTSGPGVKAIRAGTLS